MGFAWENSLSIFIKLWIDNDWAIARLNVGKNYFKNLSCKQAPLSLYQGMELGIFKIVLKGVTITRLAEAPNLQKNDKKHKCLSRRLVE